MGKIIKVIPPIINDKIREYVHSLKQNEKEIAIAVLNKMAEQFLKITTGGKQDGSGQRQEQRNDRE